MQLYVLCKEMRSQFYIKGNYSSVIHIFEYNLSSPMYLYPD